MVDPRILLLAATLDKIDFLLRRRRDKTLPHQFLFALESLEKKRESLITSAPEQEVNLV